MDRSRVGLPNRNGRGEKKDGSRHRPIGETAMYGWIISPALPGSDGALLGNDGKKYDFAYSDVHSPESLGTDSPVSFDPRDGTPLRAAEILPDTEPGTQCETLTPITDQLRGMLSPSRFYHSLRVSRIAVVLAPKAGVSAARAELAGLLHDAAKELTDEQCLSLIQQKQLPLASFESDFHPVLHAYAGAVLAEERFGIHDKEVLQAIRFHSGRPMMEPLEKVLFLADHIDKGHTLGLDFNFILDGASLDESIGMMVVEMNRYFVGAGIRPDAITEFTMDAILSSGDLLIPDSPEEQNRSFISDQLFDRALEIAEKQSIGLTTVANARQLGGYAAANGMRIRPNKLIRSASLAEMSAEDAAALRKLGINTIIDLRNPREAEQKPDIHTEGFTIISCPLPALSLNEYQQNLLEKYTLTVGREKTFYLSEYVSCVSMEELYSDILESESAQRELRRIFETLLSEECKGALFHCVSGKDRTGVVAALILLTLGAAQEAIRDDYYASVLTNFAETEAMAQNLRRRGYSSVFINEIRYYNGIGMNVAENACARVIAEYGSPEAYLKKALLLTEEELSAFRSKYLEQDRPL